MPDGVSEPLEQVLARVANGAIEALAENTPHGVPPDALKKLYQGHAVLAVVDWTLMVRYSRKSLDPVPEVCEEWAHEFQDSLVKERGERRPLLQFK